MESASLQKKATSPPPPVHVAIIMDGNGRWAEARGLPRVAGHQKGAEAVKNAVKSAISLGVSYLTLFGFSSENWKRPESEIKDLMGLLRFYIKKEINELHQEGIRFQVIGDRTRLAPDIVTLIEDAENLTEANSRLTLTIALSYGGRAEITMAARRMAEDVAAGKLDINDINENELSARLFTNDMPDPDILIRTSGEKRISNFLLWQLAYGEFVFFDTLWPDFSNTDFEGAIREFHSRERRYGATGR
ncbi:MAG: isoprenyl transferase [Proteobacteria bacterium]|nr:isoprenyl transferase [Pseudomonadota bacterium]MDA1023541.1 isoprenyl transferase [Pseudomonadota bacterium]